MLRPVTGCGFLKLFMVFSWVVSGSFSLYAQTPHQDFNQAWELFVDGKPQLSEGIVENYVNSDMEDRHLHADYLFLQACLLKKSHDRYSEAGDGFLRARRLYRNLRVLEGVHACNLELAKIYLGQDHLENAVQTLKQIIHLRNNQNYLGPTYGLLAQVALRKDDYDQAITFFNNSAEAFTRVEDFSGVAQVRLEQSRLQMSIYDWEQGHWNTLQAQRFSATSGDVETFDATLRNLAIYQQVVGSGNPWRSDKSSKRGVLRHSSENPTKSFDALHLFGDELWQPTYADPPKPTRPNTLLILSPD